MAAHYKAFSADHEIRGSVVIPYRDSVNVSNYRAYYEKHDLADLDPNGWYSMQKLLDVFNDMSGGGSVMMDFVSVGIEMSIQLQLPPEAAQMTFQDMVQSVEAVYQFNSRGTEPGYIKGIMVSDKHALFEYYTPYPDDLLYGSLYGYARRFLPQGTAFTVFYDENELRREEGGKVTLIHVEW